MLLLFRLMLWSLFIYATLFSEGKRTHRKSLSSLENKIIFAARITALFCSKMIIHEHSH